MSVPKTLDIPPGVTETRIESARLDHAAHVARLSNPRGNILLIPGWTGSKEDFTPLLPLLAAAGFQAVAYDQRGQYETFGAPDADYSLAGFAADAHAVAEASFAGAPYHLLGHSFGGLVAQQVTISFPAALKSVSLLCTGPGALGDSPTRPLARFLNSLGKVPLLQVHELREKGIKRPAQITAFLAKRFTANSAAALRAKTELLLEAPDLVDDVAATGVPAWVARGADDDAWPHEAQAKMAQRLGTEIVVLPHAAHSPAVESPDDLAAAWLPFLDAHND